MHELDAALSQIRNAWLAGRSALDAAPPHWREKIGADELALVALAGHVTDVLTRQTPGAPVVQRPLLPTLAAPQLPDPLRPRFRRLLATPKTLPSIERAVIAFTAARGFVAHPGDWLPDARDDWAPDLYAPWLDWVRAEASAAPTEETISAETYDQWPWSERRRAIERLRAQDPAAALAVIVAKAASEPAERRLRLIEALQTGLSDADAEFLESLAKDRSDRVRALARGMLARLGRSGDTPEAAAELAAMVEVRKIGLIKRRSQLVIKALKTSAQQQRRRDLFALVPLANLAAALNVSELDLTEEAPEGAAYDIVDFTHCVATTGSDAAVRALLEHLLAQPETHAVFIHPLLERLSPAERRPLVAQILARDTEAFETTFAVAHDVLGGESFAAVQSAPHFGVLQAAVHAFAHGEDAGRATAARTLDMLMPRLALLLDAPGARALLDQVVAWGLSPAEPRLDMLHFNIALTPETAP